MTQPPKCHRDVIQHHKELQNTKNRLSDYASKLRHLQQALDTMRSLNNGLQELLILREGAMELEILKMRLLLGRLGGRLADKINS